MKTSHIIPRDILADLFCVIIWQTFMLKPWALNLIAFLCGAVVMVLELIGSRVLAPYVGTSVFTWTSLIGLMLAALSIGYWYGGRWADKHADDQHLALILFLSGLGIVWTTYAQRFVPHLPALLSDVRVSALAASFILFTPATVCLGMITPLLVKRKVEDLSTTGQTVGDVYAFSTIGSIVGTFLGGFLLISYFGTNAILFGLAAILFLLAGWAHPARPWKSALVVFLLLSANTVAFVWIKPAPIPLGSTSTLVADVDTTYSRFWIYDQSSGDQTVRYLTNNRRLVQSAMFLDSGEPTFLYIKAYDLAQTFNPDAKHTLMIGAGGFIYPNHFLKTYPEKTMDIVEIDSALEGLARRFFSFEDRGRARIYAEDGRTFLNRTTETYDAILLDAFGSDMSMPFQLATQESVQKISEHLSPNGTVLVNIFGATEGRRASFLKDEYATYQSVFPFVYVLPMYPHIPSTIPQNILLIASKTALTLPPGTGPQGIGTLTPLVTDGRRPFTDAFAPIERDLIDLHS